MSELISGKEAWIAKSNNEFVQWKLIGLDWSDLTDSEFMSWDTARFIGVKTNYQFRLKPKTININGVEIEKPKDIVVDSVTGSVGLVYGDIEQSKKVSKELRSIFNVI